MSDVDHSVDAGFNREMVPAVDTTYNGWKNYPTWAVNLWLSNDHGLYDMTNENVSAIIGETESRSEYWTLTESHKFATADMLKEFLGDLIEPCLNDDYTGVGMVRDLIGSALADVDWHEIAEHWINDLGDAA